MLSIVALLRVVTFKLEEETQQKINKIYKEDDNNDGSRNSS